MKADLFLLLTKDGGKQTRRSVHIFERLGYDYRRICDENLPEEPHLRRWSEITKLANRGRPGAWGKALSYATSLRDIPDRVWFIEDDVFLVDHLLASLRAWQATYAPGSFGAPIIFDSGSVPYWQWMAEAKRYYPWPRASYNQLCCLPRRLVERLGDASLPVRFHEYWFVNEAEKINVPLVCWRRETPPTFWFGDWYVRQPAEFMKPCGPLLSHPVDIPVETGLYTGESCRLSVR